MRCPTLAELPPPPPGKSGWPWTVETPQLEDAMPDGKPWPLISIVTPSYHQGQFIEETIRSVLLQGYPDLEYIIIDGGSSDESVEIIERYSPFLAHWVSERDGGQSHAINKGFEKATGKVFAWLNSDDFYLPGAFEAIAKAFRGSDDRIGAVVGIGRKVNLRKEVVHTPKVPELSYSAFLDWMSYGHFMQPACFFSREAWLECGPLREDLYFCMDLALWLCMVRKFQFIKIPDDVARAYAHDLAKTTEQHPRMRAETAWLVSRMPEGAQIGRRELMQLADDLALAEKKIQLVVANPVYRLARKPIRFFYRIWCKVRRSLEFSR